MQRPVALIMLDGWGISAASDANAITVGHTPFYDQFRAEYPWTRLSATGSDVGLPEGAVGNAEIGHMNIGAGRTVRTAFSKIRDSVRSGEFFDNDVLCKALSAAKERNAQVHFVGLLSDADVHSSMENLYALLRMAKKYGNTDVFVHGILDGRDVLQRTADIYVEAVEIKLADIGVGKIASLCGRFYAMDSSENWERTARAFTMLVHGEGERAQDPVAAVRSSFLRGISDEFIAPIVIESSPGRPVATILDGDLVIFFNHRSDTMRQLVRSIAVPDHGMIVPSSKPKVEAVCLVDYDGAFGLPVAFEQPAEANSLAAILLERSVNNFRISESDRFTHVSRFFNCGLDETGPFEQRIEVPSGELSDRTSEPEMKSFKIADQLCRRIETHPNALFVLNIPAPGLIAETGNFSRTVEAVQYVDTCLGGIVEKINEMNGVAIITSTHGNCESMSENGSGPDRLSTANPVPFHLIDPSDRAMKLRPEGSLRDIAPTILGLIGIDVPSEMTGHDLRVGRK